MGVTTPVQCENIMVRNYKRKTVTKYTDEDLQRALEAVRNKQINSYAAAEKYGIPRSTNIHRLYGTRGAKQAKPGKPTAFSKDEETKIASLIHVMEKCGFPLTKKEILSLISEYIRRNGIITPLKDDIPGDEWLRGFRKRNKLSIKKPQSVEVARRKACNPFTVFEYFGMLEKVTNDLNLTDKPRQIYNLDETSFSNDPSNSRVIGKVGFRSTRTTSSSGKENTTVLLATNALGEKIPPLIIFQGKYMWNEWMYKNDTIKTAYAVSQKGWMETTIFEKYIKDVFIPAIGSQRPVLLVFDGHSTHVDLGVIELAAANDITILKLPAHSSDVLQPLDCSGMKPMKDRWDTELVKWQRLHVGAKLPKQEFARIITEIWDELNPAILANGFRKTGIFPVNKNAISKDKFDALSWSKWETYVKQQQKQPPEATNILKITVPTLSNLVLRMFNSQIKDELVIKKHNETQTDNCLAQDKIKRKIIKSEIVKDPKTFVLQPIHDKNINTVYSNRVKILDTKIIAPAKDKENNDLQSFEQILLQSIARNDPPKNPKKRIQSGAEVLIYKSAIERMRKEKEERENKTKNKPKNRSNVDKGQKKQLQKKTKNKIVKKEKKTYKIESSDSESTGSYESASYSEYEDMDSFYEELMKNEITDTTINEQSIKSFEDQNDARHLKRSKIEKDIKKECVMEKRSVKQTKQKKVKASEPVLALLEEKQDIVKHIKKEKSDKELHKGKKQKEKITHENPLPSTSQHQEIIHAKVGDYILAKFSSTKGKKTYKYVCLIEEIHGKKLVVCGLKSKKNNTVFRFVKDDISILDENDIISYLPFPSFDEQTDSYIPICYRYI